MSKRLRKLAVAAMTGALIVSMGVTTYAASGKTNTEVRGTHTTFDKYLVMERTASVPNYTSAYSITAGSAVAGTAVTPEVYAGIDADKVIITQTTAFAPGQETYAVVQGGDTVSLEEGEKYAVSPVDVDFSGVAFTQPGIYRYVVTELDGGDQGISIDPDAERYMDVYVESAEDGVLTIVGYVLHDDASETLADEPVYVAVPQAQVNEHYNYYVRNVESDGTQGYHISTAAEKANSAITKYTATLTGKDAGFENSYTTYDLTLEKEVTGNQGNREEYFEFTVNFKGGVPNSRYSVDLEDATEDHIAYTLNGTNTTIKSNIAQLSTAAAGEDQQGSYYFTTDGTGQKQLTFYLKDDQKIVIHGLTSVTKYAVTESKKAGEGYTESYTVAADGTLQGEAITSNVLSDTPMGDHDIDVEFINYRNGIVPTGVMIPVAPYAIATICAGVGTVVFSRKRKKH